MKAKLINFFKEAWRPTLLIGAICLVIYLLSLLASGSTYFIFWGDAANQAKSNFPTLADVRDTQGGNFNWTFIFIFAVVIYVYASELKKKNYRGIVAGLSLYGVHWLYEIANAIIGKAAGALWWLRHLMRGLMGLALVGAIGVGLGSLIFVSFEDEALSGLPVSLICGLTLALPLFSSALFLIDRGQQMILAALCALAVSAQSRTLRLAAPLAVVTALLATFLDAAIGLLVITQLEQLTTPLHQVSLLLLLFGPAVIYLAEMPFWLALGAALLTLLLREGLIWLAWHWTLRAAQRP